MADGLPVRKVDLNQATPEELRTLPGIGRARARTIVQHREEHGPFESIEDLRRVEGIPEAVFEAVRDLVTVGGAGFPRAGEAETSLPSGGEGPETASTPPPSPEPSAPPETEALEEGFPGPTPPPEPPPEPVIEDLGTARRPGRGRRFLTNLLLVLVGALLGTLLTLLILYAVNGSLLYPPRADVLGLQTQVRQLQDQDQSLSQRLVEADEEIATMQGEVAKVAALKADLEKLQEQVASLEDTYGALQEAQDDLKRQSASLQGKVNTLSAQTEGLAGRADEAEARLTSLEEMRSRLIRFLNAVKGLLQETLGPLTAEE